MNWMTWWMLLNIRDLNARKSYVRLNNSLVYRIANIVSTEFEPSREEFIFVLVVLKSSKWYSARVIYLMRLAENEERYISTKK